MNFLKVAVIDNCNYSIIATKFMVRRTCNYRIFTVYVFFNKFCAHALVIIFQFCHKMADNDFSQVEELLINLGIEHYISTFKGMRY